LEVFDFADDKDALILTQRILIKTS